MFSLFAFIYYSLAPQQDKPRQCVICKALSNKIFINVYAYVCETRNLTKIRMIFTSSN